MDYGSHITDYKSTYRERNRYSKNLLQFSWPMVRYSQVYAMLQILTARGAKETSGAGVHHVKMKM
jgi:hypothetical protein